MPQITIQRGDTLSALAAKHGTSVAELVNANKGNAAVKSADLIIAGGSLNIPEKVAAPAAGPSAEGGSGSLSVAPVQDQGAKAVGDLGNLRTALRSALNEAARKRVENQFRQVAPLSEGVPGTIGAVVDMIRSGVKTPVETTFSDIMTTFKDASEAKQKELDRINQLRLEFGSAVPSSVTDLKTALDLVAPLVDKERKLKLEKMAQDQAADNDIESWAESFAKGEVAIGNVPSGIRTQVKVRADAIKTKLETEAKQEYKDRIAFRLEKKTSDFETERSLVLQDDNLTVVEQREIIDYIDTLEQSAKATKKSSGKGFFNFLNPPADPSPSPSPTSAPQGGGSFTPSLQPFKEAFVDPFVKFQQGK